MTLDEKKLLIIDLCGRLPYDFKALYYDHEEDCEVTDIVDDISSYGYVGLGENYSLTIESIKPYLFPLSSMTDEQKTEWDYIDYYADHHEAVDWLNKNHFDYRGLIDTGLALDATNKSIY